VVADVTHRSERGSGPDPGRRTGSGPALGRAAP
jgi:hypothetical protein